jgi:TonB-dependent SusC/RagA subfamily outer membrane receptor
MERSRSAHRRWRAARVAAVLVASAACGHRGSPSSAAVPAPADSSQLASDSSVTARAAERSAGAAPIATRSATADEWEGRGASRVEELFAGRFPGVQVVRGPNGIAVRIRGATSVSGSNDPLYVVDGFPIEAGPDGLISLNPDDIARIEVLKDASSIAQYGVRGANGVVLITTKRNR